MELAKTILTVGIVGIVGFTAYKTIGGIGANDSDVYADKVTEAYQKHFEKAQETPALTKKQEKKESPVKIIINENVPHIPNDEDKGIQGNVSRGSKKYTVVDKEGYKETFITNSSGKVVGVESEKFQQSMDIQTYNKRLEEEKKLQEAVESILNPKPDIGFIENAINNPKKGAFNGFSGWF